MNLKLWRCLLFFMTLFFFVKHVSAFSWQDLWATKDQQAKEMMDKGQFKQAKDTFLREDWQAASAYRSGDYELAEKKFRGFNTEDAYYNQGNALAHMGHYERAIRAYNKALRIDPENKDALYNRKIVEDLLKKDKQQQEQDQQNQDQQDQDKQNQDKQNQDKQNQDKQNQDKQNQDKQNQDKPSQDKQNQDKQNQDKQNQDKQNQNKPNQDQPTQAKEKSEAARAQSEQQQAKDQWFRLLFDDPGGLLREKFMRDHLRRQQGWGP